MPLYEMSQNAALRPARVAAVVLKEEIMQRRVFEIIAVALSLGVMSCVVDDEVGPPDSDGVEGLQVEEAAGSQPGGAIGDPSLAPEGATLPADSAPGVQSQVCGGMCRVDANWGYTTCRWNVTQDCRERIVEFCHNRDWSFIDASWAGSCAEGWVRLWPI
jgi:hypothetical protein